MQTQFVKEGINNYLVTDKIQCSDDDYEYNLFRNQNVPYFMSCETREVNGMIKLYYKLSYRTSLNQAFGHVKFTPGKINNIMRSIVGVLETCEEYLLSSDRIICDADNVFLDINTGEMVFCYCFGEYNGGSLRDLVMEILQNTDKRHEKGGLLLLQFYNVLTETDCSIDNLKNITMYGETGISNSIDYFEEDNSNTVIDNEKYMVKPKGNNSGRKVIIKIIKTLMAIVLAVDIMLLVCLVFDVLTYEKTGFLFIGMALLIVLVIAYMQVEPEESPEEIMESYKMSEYHTDKEEIYIDDDIDKETVLLSDNNYNTQLVEEDNPGRMYLDPMDGGQYAPLFLDRESIVIGSMTGNCDYIISAKGVSRLHAKISCKNDGVYIMDMNSTNGTYLNGELLTPGKEYKLDTGDMVSFAKVIFLVCEENSSQSLVKGLHIVKEEYPA